ncbi:putative transmembrane protein [Tupanvirus soda lake]|uniref:Transmembrane protein n=2 Tax=Tupanvirus TaxID=2094720 RepID=A0AC62AAB1_9VIRU|nr:putative transmembrane protein [Tupanvirus soda lake]QKU34691.1 putative transmembrane protein [Tupanvirus soda lake]
MLRLTSVNFATKTPALNKPFLDLGKKIPKQIVLPPAAKKFYLRPNIKGPTRNRRNYSTYASTVVPATTSTFFVRNYHSSSEHHSPHKTDNQLLNIFKKEQDETSCLNIRSEQKCIKEINSSSENDESTLSTVQKNDGLGYFLKNVYLSSGVGFSGALLSSLMFAPIMTSFETVVGGFVIGIIGSFGSIYMFEKRNPQYKNKTIELFDRKFTTMVPSYEPKTYASVATLSASMGLVMSPVVMIAGPVLVAQAAGISLAVMAGSTAYAMYAKSGSLMPYKSVAYGALTGLVGISLGSIASALLFGNGNLFYLLHSIDLYGGLALFTALNAIDTHNAIDMYKKKQPDYLGCSVSMMMNALNIFIRILEILSKAQRK